jgi:two-component system, NarL family, nitrate/nitrite response regulator NarL
MSAAPVGHRATLAVSVLLVEDQELMRDLLVFGLEVLNDAALGRTVMEVSARENLMLALKDHRDAHRWAAPLLASLSPKERLILTFLMSGQSADDISNQEYIAITTVRSHIRSILRKLGVNSQLAAVVLAQKAGWRPD